jgi:hypothetical protein
MAAEEVARLVVMLAREQSVSKPRTNYKSRI